MRFSGKSTDDNDAILMHFDGVRVYVFQEQALPDFKYSFPLGSNRFRTVPSGLVMTSFFVWNRILLLSSFHKELII